MSQKHRPVGIILLTIFFGAGALICLVTMLALAFSGGFLDLIWRLRPDALIEFQKMGNWSVLLMATVGRACGLAALGLARQTAWGRRLAIGLPIGGLMIWYLVRKRRAIDQRADGQGPNT